MATTVARLEAALTLNDASFTQGIMRAEKQGATFASRWEQNMIRAFKRDPGQRAERAIGGFIERLSSGDVAGSLQNLTGSMSAFGIASGAALGAGIALFIRFRDQIKAASEAHSALRSEMISRPLSVVTQFSAEGMDQVLAARDKLAEDLRTKQEAAGTGSAIFSGIKSIFSPRGASLNLDAEKQKGLQADLNKADAERREIMLAQANVAQRLVDIQQMEIEGDKRLAGHAKARLEKEQAIAALRARNLTPDAFRIQSGALEQKQGLKDRQIDAEADAGERSLAIEEKIAKLRQKGLTAEEEKKIRATSELQDLDTQISNETSPQQLRGLKLKRQQKLNEVHAFGNPNAATGSQNEFAFGTMAYRDFENSKGFGSLEQRTKDQDDPRIFGSLGYHAAQRGEMALPKQEKGKSPEVAQALTGVEAVMEKYWGAK